MDLQWFFFKLKNTLVLNISKYEVVSILRKVSKLRVSAYGKGGGGK